MTSYGIIYGIIYDVLLFQHTMRDVGLTCLLGLVMVV